MPGHGVQDMRIHAPFVIATGAVFIPLCSIMVGLRFYARRIRGSSYGADDWTVLAALAFVIGMGVALIVEVARRKLAYPQETSSAVAGQPDANLPFWILELLQVPALGLVKLSFLFLYRRIFTTKVTERFKWLCLTMIAIIVIWTISFFFSFLFICRTNFWAYWASTVIEKENCVETAILHNAFAISDVVTDFIIIILPLPEIWQLHLRRGRKIALTGVFMLGAITIVMSAIRAGILVAADADNYDPNVDFEFLCTGALYWSMIESGLGLCAACLPVQWGLLHSHAMRDFMRSVCPISSFFSSGSRSSKRSTPKPSIRHHSSHVKMGSSQASDVDKILGAEASIAHDPNFQLQNLGRDGSSGGIMVTYGFETDGGAKRSQSIEV